MDYFTSLFVFGLVFLFQKKLIKNFCNRFSIFLLFFLIKIISINSRIERLNWTANVEWQCGVEETKWKIVIFVYKINWNRVKNTKTLCFQFVIFAFEWKCITVSQGKYYASALCSNMKMYFSFLLKFLKCFNGFWCLSIAQWKWMEEHLSAANRKILINNKETVADVCLDDAFSINHCYYFKVITHKITIENVWTSSGGFFFGCQILCAIRFHNYKNFTSGRYGFLHFVNHRRLNYFPSVICVCNKTRHLWKDHIFFFC